MGQHLAQTCSAQLVVGQINLIIKSSEVCTSSKGRLLWSESEYDDYVHVGRNSLHQGRKKTGVSSNGLNSKVVKTSLVMGSLVCW